MVIGLPLLTLLLAIAADPSGAPGVGEGYVEVYLVDKDAEAWARDHALDLEARWEIEEGVLRLFPVTTTLSDLAAALEVLGVDHEAVVPGEGLEPSAFSLEPSALGTAVVGYADSFRERERERERGPGTADNFVAYGAGPPRPLNQAWQRVERSGLNERSKKILRSTLLGMGLRPENPERTEVSTLLPWLVHRMQRGELVSYDTGLRWSARNGLTIPYLDSVKDWFTATRPKDLFSRSYRDAALEAFRWHVALSQSKEGSTILTKRRVHVVYEWPDGMYGVEIDDPDSARLEGRAMGSCVGQYADQIGRSLRIFSLRTREGRPVTTIGIWSDGSVREVKGRSNAAPVAKYAPKVLEWLVVLQPDTAKWGSDAWEVGQVAEGSPGIHLGPNQEVFVTPPPGSYVQDKEIGVQRGRSVDTRREVEVRTNKKKAVVPWPFPEQIATVGRFGSKQAVVQHGYGPKFSFSVWTYKVYESGRRQLDGVPTWRILYQDELRSGRRPSKKMIDESEQRADKDGLPFDPDRPFPSLDSELRAILAEEAMALGKDPLARRKKILLDSMGRGWVHPSRFRDRSFLLPLLKGEGVIEAVEGLGVRRIDIERDLEVDVLREVFDKPRWESGIVQSSGHRPDAVRSKLDELAATGRITSKQHFGIRDTAWATVPF